MKLYAPAYYKNFKCIADKCEHSCCIGWEIDVDKVTLEKYKSLNTDYGRVIADSISYEDTPHFKLGECDRCPHLDERGLCKIILNEGEDLLSDICREHPRFYNFTSVAEVGIGMSCPEAARIILSSPDYTTTECVGNVDADAYDLDFDGRIERDKIYAILQNTKYSYSDRLEHIYNLYSIERGIDEEWLEKLNSLEYLNEAHKDLFMHYSSKISQNASDLYQERFLAYLIFRHCTEALDIENFCEKLTFCLFCERLLVSMTRFEDAKSLQEVANLASIISEEIEYSDDNTFALTY